MCWENAVDGRAHGSKATMAMVSMHPQTFVGSGDSFDVLSVLSKLRARSDATRLQLAMRKVVDITFE